jgi:hypothetical protein
MSTVIKVVSVVIRDRQRRDSWITPKKSIWSSHKKAVLDELSYSEEETESNEYPDCGEFEQEE